MARRWPPCVLLPAILAALACEVEGPSILEVVVRVEPSLRPSTSLPAQVLVGFDTRGSGYLVFRVGFLCAQGDPFSTTATFPVPGADGTAAVDGWLAPVDGGFPPACGPLPAPQPVPPRGGFAGAPRSSARAELVGGCGSGDVRAATLVLGASS